MNPNDPLQGALKNLEEPHLPQQGINSFLNEALKKADAAGNLASLSGDLSKRIASMTSAADWSRQLLRSFEPQKSPLQKIIDEAARTAAVYRNLGSQTDTIMRAAACMRASPDISRELLRSFQSPIGSIQLAIDAVQKSAFQLTIDNLQHIREHIDAIPRLTKLYSSPAFGGISRAIQQAMAASQLWQSAPITDFASRVIRDAEFREAVLQRLESEPFADAQPEAAQISTEQILEAVEGGIEEAEGLKPADSVEAAVTNMFSSWEKLNPDLRAIVIGLIVMILHLTLEHSVLKDQSTSQLPVKQRVKIVQKITNNIFVNVGVSAEERRRFRVVTKDAVPVFRFNRRDAGKIGSLTAGQVVTVKFQKRNWTEIEWKDTASQEMRTGWVFTRYLKKI